MTPERLNYLKSEALEAMRGHNEELQTELEQVFAALASTPPPEAAPAMTALVAEAFDEIQARQRVEILTAGLRGVLLKLYPEKAVDAMVKRALTISYTEFQALGFPDQPTTPPASPGETALDLEAEVYTESSPNGNAVGLRIDGMEVRLSFGAALLMARNLEEAVAEQTGDDDFMRLQQTAEREPYGPFRVEAITRQAATPGAQESRPQTLSEGGATA